MLAAAARPGPARLRLSAREWVTVDSDAGIPAERGRTAPTKPPGISLPVAARAQPLRRAPP